MIDTHVHLDHHLYGEDLDIVLENARKVGVKGFVIPAADPADLIKAQEISHRFDDVFFAVGAHPYHQKEFVASDLMRFIEDKKCVAIGECGLDYYRLPQDLIAKENEIKEQKEVFKAQIDLAKQFDLPLIVHIRDASLDTKNIILDSGFKNGGVLHCFNADEELLSLAGNGFCFGIGGVYTFKNAKKLPQVVPKIPKDRLLLETDAPYLTPHPHRGKRNEPAFVDLVATALSENLHIQKSDLIDQTTKNAINCFPKLQAFFG